MWVDGFYLIRPVTKISLYPVHQNKLILGNIVPAYDSHTRKEISSSRRKHSSIRDSRPMKLDGREDQTEDVVGDPESTVAFGHKVECLDKVLGSILTVGLINDHVSFSY